MNRFHALIFAIAASCGLSAAAQSPVRFTTTDTTLQRTFDWACDMALSYVHDGSGPVGLWYEAALPGRDAFCMRGLASGSRPRLRFADARNEKKSADAFRYAIVSLGNFCYLCKLKYYNKLNSQLYEVQRTK